MRMRTVERFASIFGIVNLVLGVVGMLTPFVSHRQNRNFLTRRLPGRRHGLINREPGQLFGFMGAVNPQQSILHTALGAAGLATRTRPMRGYTRAYMGITAAIFLITAMMGWIKTGFQPGMKNVGGLAVDWKDNLIHTLFGGTALLMAAKPDIGMNAIEREVYQTVDEVGMHV